MYFKGPPNITNSTIYILDMQYSTSPPIYFTVLSAVIMLYSSLLSTENLSQAYIMAETETNRNKTLHHGRLLSSAPLVDDSDFKNSHVPVIVHSHEHECSAKGRF